MLEIKRLLEEYRAALFAKHATNDPEREETDKLLVRIHELMKDEPNKEELVRLWNNNFTGMYNLGGIE